MFRRTVQELRHGGDLIVGITGCGGIESIVMGIQPRVGTLQYHHLD